MKKEDFERFNALSEKILLDIASPHELEEFSHLLTTWNESTEYNLLQGLYVPNPKGSLF